MKEIVIVTSYYPPEIGAASNRIKQLAEGLKDNGYNVWVITPLPNYPTGKIFTGFKRKLIDKSDLNGVKVVRLWIYPSISKNKLIRLFAMLSYSISLGVFYIFNRIPKTVIVQCSPLIVGFTSMLMLKSKKRKLVLNISDLWPKAGLELGALKEGMFVDILRKIERFNYRRADLILGQSKEIIRHVESIYPEKRTFLYRNYPVINSNIAIDTVNPQTEKIRMVYAGLLGVAQGVLDICKNLDFNNNIEFHIYGDGAERFQIEEFVRVNPHLPILYHGNIKREYLHVQLVKYDIALIPLKNRIYGSVPSKIFEYAKLGLPIIYFGGGEGEEIVLNYKLGYISKAGSHTDLNRVIRNIKKADMGLQMTEKIKSTSKKYFSFENQLKDFIDLI